MRKVLIVDDEASIRAVLRGYFAGAPAFDGARFGGRGYLVRRRSAGSSAASARDASAPIPHHQLGFGENVRRFSGTALVSAVRASAKWNAPHVFTSRRLPPSEAGLRQLPNSPETPRLTVSEASEDESMRSVSAAWTAHPRPSRGRPRGWLCWRSAGQRPVPRRLAVRAGPAADTSCSCAATRHAPRVFRCGLADAVGDTGQGDRGRGRRSGAESCGPLGSR